MTTPNEVVLAGSRPRRRSAAKLSLTPLVDCVFILLIFFMLQSNMLRPNSMALLQSKPEAAPTRHDSSDRPTVLYIELQADQSVWVDGARHSLASLPLALESLRLSDFKSAIVAVDPGVPLQRAVDVIDMLGTRGMANVLLREARQFK
jgi:biopolymer transport protein ExbD